MLPVIILGAVALGVAIFGTNYFSSDKQKERVEKKKIAILGSRGTGKSSFYEFLVNGKLDSNRPHNSTKAKENVGKKFNIDEITKNIGGVSITFDLLNSYDVSGNSEYALDDWKKAVESADFLLYLINIHEVLNGRDNFKTIDTIKKDIERIAEIVRNKSFRGLMIVCSHADKCSQYNKNFDEFYADIMKNSTVNMSILQLGGREKCKLVVGSLKDTTEADKLLREILNKI